MTASGDDIRGMGDRDLRSWLLLGIVALALIPRLLFLAETFDRVEFNYLVPGLDPYRFQQSALRIRAGDVLLADAPYEQGPFYSYYLAALYTVFPMDVRTARVVQAFVGVATCVVIYLLALRWFPPWISFACAALYCLYGFAILLESTILRACHVGFAYLLLLYHLIRFAETRRMRWIVSAGLVLGFAITLRPNSFLLLAAIVPALALRTPAARGSQMWLVMAVMTFLPVLPVLMRNAYLGHPLLHMSSQGFGVFVAGNMPDARGVGWLVSEQGEELLRRARGDVLQVLVGVANAVVQHPLDWLLVQLRKLHALFASYEIPNNLNYYLSGDLSRVLRLTPVGFHAIASLALPGLFLAWRRHGERYLLYGMFAGVFLTIFPFYVIARFRLPLVALLCIFAGFVFEEIRHALVERRYRSAGLVAAGVVFAAVVTISPVRERREPGAYVNLASVYHETGHLKKAVTNYRRALEGRPKLKRASEQLVILYLAESRFGEARNEARRHLALRPKNAEMQLLLARAYAGTGDLRAAAEILARLVSGSHARRADAHYELGRVLLAQGDAEGSLRAFREAHRLDAEFEPASEAIRAAEERKAREERAAPRLGGLHAVPE